MIVTLSPCHLVTLFHMPIKRHYPEAPILGVGAIVFDDAGRVLLIQRGKPPRAGQWSIPGGMVELGEKLLDAVQREVKEECSIDIEIGDVVLIYEPIFHDAEGKIEFHYVLVDYWARHSSGEAVANDDALAVAWVALDALPEYHLPQATFDVIHKSYGLWAVGR